MSFVVDDSFGVYNASIRPIREYSSTLYVGIGQVRNGCLYLNEEVEYKRGGPGVEMPVCHGDGR